MSDTVAELKPELTIDQQLAILSRATPGKLAETYLRLRDKRDAYQAQADSFQKKMDLLETALLAKLTELSQDGFNATGYTIYKYTLVTGRIADPAGSVSAQPRIASSKSFVAAASSSGIGLPPAVVSNVVVPAPESVSALPIVTAKPQAVPIGLSIISAVAGSIEVPTTVLIVRASVSSSRMPDARTCLPQGGAVPSEPLPAKSWVKIGRAHV